MSIESVRLANQEEASAIAQLVNAAYRPEVGLGGWTHESMLVSGNRINAQQISKALLQDNCAILVGLKASQIVACVQIEKEASSSCIGMLAVSPSIQGTGLGKQMLAHAESYAIKNFHSNKFTMLVVSSRHELVSFYLRRGYVKTGCVMSYPLSEGVGNPIAGGLTIEALEKAV